MSGALIAHVPLRQTVQVLLHNRHKPVERAPVRFAPRVEEPGNPVAWEIQRSPSRGVLSLNRLRSAGDDLEVLRCRRYIE